MAANIITGGMVSGLKTKERSRQRCKRLTLRDIHKLFLQMWYAVLLPELHYKSLWASVTARVWGKLHHYVPGENEILLSSCTLEALLPQTVRLIKSSQFGLEFLTPFSQKEKRSTSTFVKKLKCFISNLILLGFLCKQLVCNSWRVHWTWGNWAPMLQDVWHHLRLTQQPKLEVASADSASYCCCLRFTSITDGVFLLCFHCLGLRCFYCLISSVCILDPHFLLYKQTWNLRLPLGSALGS